VAIVAGGRDANPRTIVRIVAPLRCAGNGRDMHHSWNPYQIVLEATTGLDAIPDLRTVRFNIPSVGIRKVYRSSMLDGAVVVASSPEKDYTAASRTAILSQLSDSSGYQGRRSRSSDRVVTRDEDDETCSASVMPMSLSLSGSDRTIN